MTECPRCRKNAYPTRADARNVRRALADRLRIYRCPHGNGWHLTSRTQRRRLADTTTGETR